MSYKSMLNMNQKIQIVATKSTIVIPCLPPKSIRKPYSINGQGKTQ